MIFKSYTDLIEDIKTKLIPLLPRDIEVVYGIPRSGMIVASIVSNFIGAKLGVYGEESYIGERSKYFHQNSSENKILIIDDNSRTGKTLQNLNLDLLKAKNPNLYTCVVYTTKKTSTLVDFFAEETAEKRIFEWNFSGIKMTQKSAWDLDGVICTNPTVFDDDGEIYYKEITEVVKPLILPLVPIKAIITNRIEKWRNETELWLRKHNVVYDQLIMQPFPSASERRKNSKHYQFKSQHLKTLSNISFFVESDLKQAKIISEMTNIPVLCTETMKLF